MISLRKAAILRRKIEILRTKSRNKKRLLARVDMLSRPKKEHADFLAEKKFTHYRDLSLQEQRVNFEILNETYNEKQARLKREMIALIAAMIAAGLISMRNRLKAGSVAGIGDLVIINANKLDALLNGHIKEAFEVGKITAAKELNIPVPTTPMTRTQLMNLDSSMIAEQIATSVDLAAKQKAKDGFTKKVETAAIIAAVGMAARKAASQAITHAVGNIAGENINKGRRAAFEVVATNIQGYQRSEILDNRTCGVCEELDGQIVTADDPFAQLDEVHDNCRGIWVPIKIDEPFNESDAGIPPDLADRFETIGGAPTTNSFSQLSKPLDTESKAIAENVSQQLAIPQQYAPPFKTVDVDPRAIEYRSAKTAQEVVNDVQSGRTSLTNGPILVAEDEAGRLRILDGAHRMEAAKAAGAATIKANIVTEADLAKYGVDAYDKINIPVLGSAQAAEYGKLGAGPKELYDALVKAGVAHPEAISEAGNWAELEKKYRGFDSYRPRFDIINGIVADIKNKPR